MVETVNSLVALSDATAQLVERAAGSIVSVNSGSRWSSSGIHWRSGIIVTAEEVLERDENIELTLLSGRSVEASLEGQIQRPTLLCFGFSLMDYRQRRPPRRRFERARPSLP